MSDDEADDAGLYENLPNFFLDETYKNLEEEKKELKTKVEELGKQLDEIRKENEKLAAKVKALGKNISCLYKTAIRELERKDQIIADLRKERDDLLFRRGTNYSSVPETKRSNRKQLTPTKKVRNGNIRRPDLRTKINTSKPEEPSISKAVEIVQPELPKEKTPERIIPVDKITEVKIASPKEKIVPAVKTAEEKEVPPISESKIEEIPIEECNSKEETVLETSSSEKTPANVSNIQILSGSEDSFVQTPSSEKFTSHAMTEDCGFGRRRKVRRIIRATSSSAGSTPVRSTLEPEGNVPPEVQPPPAKKICAEADPPSADNSPRCSEADAKNDTQKSASEKVTEDAGTLGQSVSIDPSVPENDIVVAEQQKVSEEADKGKQAENIESGFRKEDEHNSQGMVYESCEVDLKISSTDEQSTNSGNLSVHSQSDCSSLTPVNHTAAEVKARTITYVEEYSVSSIEFENNKCGSPTHSSTPRCDRVMYPGECSPGENRGKRPRSWERERNQVDSTNLNHGGDRRTRYPARDSFRDRDRRDSHYDRDNRSSRVSNSGGDRRMDRDPRGDRNYRSRGRDRGDYRSHRSDSMRYRDDDVRRDSDRRGRTRSRERRVSDHRSSSKNRESERGSGHSGRDRSRREMEEQERAGSRNNSKADNRCKPVKSPKPFNLLLEEHLRSKCVPPTEWD